MESFFRHFFFIITAVFLLGSTTTRVVVSQTITIRGNQYCEILWGGPLDENQQIPTNGGLTMTISWNGFNGKCQSNPGFYNLTAEDIYTIHGEKAELIKFNGVREFLIDESIGGPTTTTPMVFDRFGSNINDNGSGLLMLRIAEVMAEEEIDVGYYVPRRMNAKSNNNNNETLAWHAGKIVYELIAPNCSAIYTMHSFMIGRPDSSSYGIISGKEDLLYLVENDRMILPNNEWIYRARTLSEDLIITARNEMIQDNLENSYFRMDIPHDMSLCPKKTTTTTTNTNDETENFTIGEDEENDTSFDYSEDENANNDNDNEDHVSTGSSVASKISSNMKENKENDKEKHTTSKKKEGGMSTEKKKENGTKKVNSSKNKKEEDGTNGKSSNNKNNKEKKDKEKEKKITDKVKKEKKNDDDTSVDKEKKGKDKKNKNSSPSIERRLKNGHYHGIRGIH